MNRYILFFVLINLSTNIVPSPTSENVEKKEKHETLKKEMLSEFDNKFDLVIGIDGLNQQGHENAIFLKNICHEYLAENIDKFFGANKEAIKKDIEKEGAISIATFARLKSEYEYKRHAQEIKDKVTKKEIGKEAYKKALDEFQQGIPGSLAYLVNGFIEKDIFEKTKTICNLRLRCKIMIISFLIKHRISELKN